MENKIIESIGKIIVNGNRLEIPKECIEFQPFRSNALINQDYDVGRITIDLPSIEAKKVLTALKTV